MEQKWINTKGKFLSYDKLIVEGKPYTLADLKNLPKDLNPAISCEKEDDNILGIFGRHSPFSNFYISGFKVLRSMEKHHQSYDNKKSSGS